MTPGMTEPAARPRIDAPRIMIVDDDAEMRALLRDALEREGFRVHEHAAAEGLMPLIASWAPHVVVLDKVMTGSSGLDVLRHMHRDHPETPVVFVTAFGGSEVETEARKLGAAYYMDKPFRVTRLLEVLKTVLGQAGAKHVRMANVDRT